MRADQPPVLLAEGFRWGAFLFGPCWLLRYRAFIPAAVAAAALIAIVVLTAGALLGVLVIGIALMLGFNGNDLRRWSLEQRGFLLSDVVVASDAEDGLARLLARRPEQLSRMR